VKENKKKKDKDAYNLSVLSSTAIDIVMQHKYTAIYRILPALRMLILRLVITRATANPSGTLCTARDREMNWPEVRERGNEGGKNG
jgi:hypothetical protein